MAEKADAKYVATVSMKVTRADGTEEDLGVIEVGEADAAKVEKLISTLRPEDGGEGISLEEANRRNAEESKRNEEETKRLLKEEGRD